MYLVEIRQRPARTGRFHEQLPGRKDATHRGSGVLLSGNDGGDVLDSTPRFLA
jgi:hypothetical protein